MSATAYQTAAWPLHPTEHDRLTALRGLVPNGGFGDAARSRLDALAGLIADDFQVQTCCISFVESIKQVFEGMHGERLTDRESGRESSFCTHAILPSAPDVFQVTDAKDHADFCNNPFVVGPSPLIRFYAASPIVHAPSGQRVGVVCIFNPQPRTLTPAEKSRLQAVASMATRFVEQLAAASAGAAMPSPTAAWAGLPGKAQPAPTADSACTSAGRSEDGPSASPGVHQHPAAAAATACAPAAAPPWVPPRVHGLGWRGVDAEADVLLSALVRALGRLDARVSPISELYPWTLCAETLAGDRHVAVRVTLLPAATGTGGHDVLVRRCGGDTFAFHAFVRGLHAKLHNELPTAMPSRLCRV